MGGGEVLEQGTHNELLASDGAYAKLVSTQRLAAAVESESDGSTAADDNSIFEKNGKSALKPDLDEKEFNQLERTATGGASLSSQILADRRDSRTAKAKILPYPTIFKRLGW